MFITVNQDIVNLEMVTHVTASGSVVLTGGNVLQCKDEAEHDRLVQFLTQSPGYRSAPVVKIHSVEPVVEPVAQ